MANMTFPSKVTKKFSRRYLNYDGFMVLLNCPATVIHTSEFDPDNNPEHTRLYNLNLLQSARSRLEAEKIKLSAHLSFTHNENERNILETKLNNIEKDHPEWLI